MKKTPTVHKVDHAVFSEGHVFGLKVTPEHVTNFGPSASPTSYLCRAILLLNFLAQVFSKSNFGKMESSTIMSWERQALVSPIFLLTLLPISGTISMTLKRGRLC